MGAPVYTHCVDWRDYKDDTPSGNLLEVLGGVIIGGGLDLVSVVCDYLLGGKLVCLPTPDPSQPRNHGDHTLCAIGHITQFEPASSKSFPDSLDNDFSFAILLAPHGLGEFAYDSRANNHQKVANDGEQGYLIAEQPYVPYPREASSNSNKKFEGNYTTYPSSSYLDYDPSKSPFQVPGSDVPFDVPILHCECEGSRIHDVCAAVSSVWGPVSGSGICDFNPFGIPIGKLACTIISTAVAPLAAAVAAWAWANATDGNPDDARLDPDHGELQYGNLVVVTGRWVFDAGHVGWNEFHPILTIQKIDESSVGQAPDFTTFHDQWCGTIAKTPPAGQPGQPPPPMTPEQQQTYNNQVQPQNRWAIHPLVDGCNPSDSAPPNIR
ncbi:MAG: hypothetical protein ACXWNK_03600 [Vulcanimicrobiaceae bacterium]